MRKLVMAVFVLIACTYGCGDWHYANPDGGQNPFNLPDIGLNPDAGVSDAGCVPNCDKNQCGDNGCGGKCDEPYDYDTSNKCLSAECDYRFTGNQWVTVDKQVKCAKKGGNCNPSDGECHYHPTVDGGTDTGVDVGQPDTGTPDVGEPDSGIPDSGEPDSGTPDGGCIPDCANKCGGPDGCNGTCSDNCVAPQTCGGGGVQFVCGCTSEDGPTFCARLGKNCDNVTADDNCGLQKTYNCGTCTAPQSCGGGGTTNVCGCTAVCAGKICGDLDGCGGTCVQGSGCCTPVCTGVCGGPDTCGGTCPDNCTLPQTCGGGGTQNVCGCTPACTGKCGGPDGCGGTCPDNCVAPQTCGGSGTPNVCGCTPSTCHDQGKNCGSISNGCGNNIKCGDCILPQTCGGGGTANVCGCTLDCNGKECGDNGCGGSCGTCQPTFFCETGTCETACPTADLGQVTGNGVVSSSNSGAVDAYIPSCTFQLLSSGELYYKWQAPSDGVFTISTRGSNYDTVLDVLDGSCGGPELACNDDISATTDKNSEVQVPLVLGQVVVVVVDGYNGAVGNFVLNVNLCTPACAGKCSGDDSCGGTCSDNCVLPESCGGGVIPDACGCTPPVPEVQACLGKCGLIPDGCGNNFDCGGCVNGFTCQSNNLCSCVSGKLCSAGSVCCQSVAHVCDTNDDCCLPACAGVCGGPDGCGGICPDNCQAPETCGGGGTQDVCGCTPVCVGVCGGPDTCGGTCPDNCVVPTTCGGGGTPNVCGCTPACAGLCGGPDSCGGTCPDNCVAPQTCGGGGTPNVCGCAPNCTGKTCGDDGCGGSCGSCTSPAVCFNNSCCTPNCAGKTCGDDGCGGSCGPCSSLETCISGACVVTHYTGLNSQVVNDANDHTVVKCVAYHVSTRLCEFRPATDGLIADATFLDDASVFVCYADEDETRPVATVNCAGTSPAPWSYAHACEFANGNRGCAWDGNCPTSVTHPQCTEHAQCLDTSPCTDDLCVSGVCAHNQKVCPDQDATHLGYCDVAGVCQVGAPSGCLIPTDCAAPDACHQAPACTGGQCDYAAVDCGVSAGKVLRGCDTTSGCFAQSVECLADADCGVSDTYHRRYCDSYICREQFLCATTAMWPPDAAASIVGFNDDAEPNNVTGIVNRPGNSWTGYVTLPHTCSIVPMSGPDRTGTVVTVPPIWCYSDYLTPWCAAGCPGICTLDNSCQNPVLTPGPACGM